MKNSDFRNIGIRGMVVDAEKFVVSKADPAGSIIREFTDCSDSDKLTTTQKLKLLTYIFESTYGAK